LDDICSGTSTPFSRYSNIPSYRNENINDQLDEAIYMNEFSEE
jgi:predicted lipase